MSAESVWSRISPYDINRVLSSESLSILEPLLDRTPNDPPLKDDKFEKAQIYKMSVVYELHKRSFRDKIFSYLTKEELIEISKIIGLPIAEKDIMKNNLINVPWGNNSESLQIADFIGVPRFALDIASTEIKNIPDNIYPWIVKYDFFLNPPKKDCFEVEFANRLKFKTLKPFQAIAHQEILEKISINFGKCILNMPTGTGKTRTSMEVVCSFLLEHPYLSVVWVAPSNELLDQAALEFSQIWEFLGDRKIRVVKFYSGQKQKLSEDSSFIITSFQTLVKNTKDFNKVPVGLIVVDEAHMTIAEKWKKGIDSLKKPELGTKILGLTATPVRSYLDTNKLVNYYNNNLVQIKNKNSDKSIFDSLIEDGILARPLYDKLYGGEITLSNSQLQKMKEINADFPIEFLEQLAKNGPRNLKIIKKLKEILGNPEDTRQVLFFGLNVEHSKLITTWLLKNNYSAFHLDAKADLQTRKSCIEAFKNGKLRVLCNYGVLSTGFDVPKVDCVFIARPTTSHVLHSQMVGRGLRGPKLGGTHSCLIVEVDDNIRNFLLDQKVSFEKYSKLWDRDTYPKEEDENFY